MGVRRLGFPNPKSGLTSLAVSSTIPLYIDGLPLDPLDEAKAWVSVIEEDVKKTDSGWEFKRVDESLAGAALAGGVLWKFIRR